MPPTPRQKRFLDALIAMEATIDDAEKARPRNDAEIRTVLDRLRRVVHWMIRGCNTQAP